jgi:hypothetical protein
VCDGCWASVAVQGLKCMPSGLPLTSRSTARLRFSQSWLRKYLCLYTCPYCWTCSMASPTWAGILDLYDGGRNFLICARLARRSCYAWCTGKHFDEAISVRKSCAASPAGLVLLAISSPCCRKPQASTCPIQAASEQGKPHPVPEIWHFDTFRRHSSFRKHATSSNRLQPAGFR